MSIRPLFFLIVTIFVIKIPKCLPRKRKRFFLCIYTYVHTFVCIHKLRELKPIHTTATMRWWPTTAKYGIRYCGRWDSMYLGIRISENEKIIGQSCSCTWLGFISSITETSITIIFNDIFKLLVVFSIHRTRTS